MTKNQVKFYVDDDEKRRLEVLAKRRHMTIPQYVKLTALGVKVQQVKEVFIEPEKPFYPPKEEKLIMSDEIFKLSDEDKAVLKALFINHYNPVNATIQFDEQFNKRLMGAVMGLLKFIEQGD